MIKSFFKVAYRNLTTNKIYSFINIAGLATGMAVALLIGLWIHDECTFNKSVDNYRRLGKIWQFVKFGPVKSSYDVSPQPLASELRDKYLEIENSSLNVERNEVFHFGDQNMNIQGHYVEPAFPSMFSLKMISGNYRGLKEMHSVMLAQSAAKALFGDKDPMGLMLRMGDSVPVKVTGVFRDFPANSDFKDLHFLAPWDLFAANETWVQNAKDQWDNNSFNIYILVKPGTDFKRLSAKIRDIRMKRSDPPAYKPEFFIHPMSQWHLYSEFYDGKNTGGRITYVWLFGIIGVFVLLLACINFMNLSTARSEKRSKEVGIRKTIGSVRGQLILQFFSESVLYVICSFILALLLVILALPFFNQIAGKEMTIAWTSPVFWIVAALFSLFTAIIAGSYPAFYLSGFDAIQVLKGTFKAGRFAALPRKVLVVFQFTVSVTMIIGTVVIFRQIQFVKDRPVGYNRGHLIELKMSGQSVSGHYEALRKDLINSGAAVSMSEASGPLTEQWGGSTNISWSNKTPDEHPLLMSNQVTHDYGQTIGWQIKQGRDFSRSFGADTSSMILNESAVRIMGFKNPISQQIQTMGKTYQVIGVTADMIKESPFQEVKPSFYVVDYYGVGTIEIKLSAILSTHEALTRIEKVFKRYDPGTPFSYHFVDQQYAAKFSDEEKISTLSAFFAGLAIAISVLGLFGLASFVAEKRTKEIGIRKILGASIWNVWGLLSKEFIGLVTIALLIAMPLSYYAMHHWLEGYEFRTPLSIWIFVSVGLGAMFITLFTISFQSIKAAITNPVNSLRSE